MEVLLKKTKITPSILKQSLKSTSADFKKGTVLGWCIYNKTKHIVCYREDINSLSICMLFDTIHIVTYGPSPDVHDVKLSYEKNYVDTTYRFTKDVEASEFLIIFQNAKNEAERKGQFYL